MTPHALLALELAGYGLGSGLIGLLIGRYVAPSARAVAAAPGDELAGELNRMWEAGYDQGYQEGRHDGRDERPADTRLLADEDRSPGMRPDGADSAAGADASPGSGAAMGSGSGSVEVDLQADEWEPAPTDLIARQARYHQPITATFRATTLADVKTWAARGETFLHDWHEEALADAAEFDRWMIGYAEHLEAVKSASWTDRLVREGM